MNIFAFWHDKSKIPPYLQLCFETWRKSIKNHEVILLDYGNIDKYTDIRKQGYWKPLTSGKYRMALVADVIRVDLLCKYGGLWMDMDTIITSPDFEKQYLNIDP
jgi:mannosyltransferase OCH1-like enzyme